MEDSRQVGEQGKPLKSRAARVVESQIVRSENYTINGTLVPQGAWLVGIKVYDPAIQKAIRSGRYTALQINGRVTMAPGGD